MYDIKIQDGYSILIVTARVPGGYCAVECNKGGFIHHTDLVTQYPGVTYENSFNVCRFVVSEQYRNQGIGTAIFKTFIEYADKMGYYLDLGINPYGDLTYDQLQKFYEKFGFTEIEEGLFFRVPNTH